MRLTRYSDSYFIHYLHVLDFIFKMKVDIYPFKNKKIIEYKGTNAEELRKALSQSAKNLTMTQKHEIRQQILSSEIMKQTKSISCDLSVRHYHIDYEF